MKGMILGAMLVTGILAALPASATIVRDPWSASSGCDELNLFEIVNTLYGTSFASTYQMNFAQTDPSGAIFAGPDGIKAEARYASWQQTFGWYQFTGSGDPVVHNDLFTITQEGLGNFGTATINPTGSYGFYDAVGPCWNPDMITWYSEPDENICREDHLVTYDLGVLTNNVLYANHLLLGWEDKPFCTSDRDYQDLVLELFPVQGGGGGGGQPGGNTPEPGTLVLLSIGAAAGAFQKIRRVF